MKKVSVLFFLWTLFVAGSCLLNVYYKSEYEKALREQIKSDAKEILAIYKMVESLDKQNKELQKISLDLAKQKVYWQQLVTKQKCDE